MNPADRANAERVARMKAVRRAELKAAAVKAKAEEESRAARELMLLNAAIADCLSQLQATWLAPMRHAETPVRELADSETRQRHREVPFDVPGHRAIYLIIKFIASWSTGYWMPCVAPAWKAIDAEARPRYFDNLADALICAEITDQDRERDSIPF